MVYGDGRVCQEMDCTTVLNKYNPQPYCFIHEIKDDGGRKPRDLSSRDGYRICVECKEEKVLSDKFFRPIITRLKDGSTNLHFGWECRTCANAKRNHKIKRRYFT